MKTNIRENLVSACESWPDVESVLDNTIALEDETVLIDLLNVINRRINVWNLSMCHKLLSGTFFSKRLNRDQVMQKRNRPCFPL